LFHAKLTSDDAASATVALQAKLKMLSQKKYSDTQYWEAFVAYSNGRIIAL
jgi:CHAT domain-containing protein